MTGGCSFSHGNGKRSTGLMMPFSFRFTYGMAAITWKACQRIALHISLWRLLYPFMMRRASQ